MYFYIFIQLQNKSIFKKYFRYIIFKLNINKKAEKYFYAFLS